MIRFLILSLSIILCQSCAPKPSESCGARLSVYGDRIIWKNIPVDLYLDSSVTEIQERSIKEAALVWESAVGKRLFKFFRLDRKVNPVRDHFNTISITSKWSRNSAEQAVAYIRPTYYQIYEADIEVNSENFVHFYSSEDYSMTKVSFKSLMVHELGHFLGLVHSGYRESTMFPTLAYGIDRSMLTTEDRKNILCLYGN